MQYGIKFVVQRRGLEWRQLLLVGAGKRSKAAERRGKDSKGWGGAGEERPKRWENDQKKKCTHTWISKERAEKHSCVPFMTISLTCLNVK